MSRLLSSKQFNKQVLSLWWSFIERAARGWSLARPQPSQFAARPSGLTADPLPV